jgi:hypothetical protein
VYRQLTINTHVSQSSAVNIINQCLSKISNKLYEIPLDVIYNKDEFFENPPLRYEAYRTSTGEQEKITTALSKRKAFFDSPKYIELETLARDAINNLNNAAEYLENGYISYPDGFSHHHVKILRVLHIVEPFRSKIEQDTKENYAHRLPRLRKIAITYHYANPKLCDRPLTIELSSKDKIELYPRIADVIGTEYKSIIKRHIKKYRKKYNHLQKLYTKKF